MSANLEYRAGERQRRREIRQQTSETQREKGRQRCIVRDKKQRRHFSLKEQHENFVVAVTKMRNTSGHQCKEKMSGSQSEREHVRHQVSRCSRPKQWQKNVQKNSVLQVQSSFSAN